MNETDSDNLEAAYGPKVHELAPVAAELMQSSLTSTRPNAHLLPVPEARRNFDSDFAAIGPGEPVLDVTDHQVPVDGGEITVRAFRPATGELPAVVYFHGGGWLLGSLDSHDAVCRALANAAGCAVVSVDYRRGPEARFPTAVMDAYAATVWVVDHASSLGIDSDRVAVAGDSAGANLAIATGLLAKQLGRPQLTMQLLAYPVTTTDLAVGFDDDYEGFSLYRDELQWHQDNYLPSPEARQDPLVSPLEHADLTDLPPALVITAQCDPLHRQGELFAQALQRAGVSADHRQWAGMIHGFVQLPSVFTEGAEAIEVAAAALRRATVIAVGSAFSLEGRTAVVTGASRGIGRGVARRFAEAGANLVVTARTATGLQALCDELGPDQVAAAPGDVSNPDDVARAIAVAQDRFGRLDILCHCAGIYPETPIEAMSTGDWHAVLDTNLTSTFLTVRACMPIMRAQGSGRIVLISSITGSLTGYPGLAHYAATKAGMLGFMRSAALELAPDSITINAIGPGSIRTEGLADLGADALASMEAYIPLGCLGDPDDIAFAAMFLASDAARYITGQTLVVDGGQTLPEFPF
jgi:acetyl esterase